MQRNQILEVDWRALRNLATPSNLGFFPSVRMKLTGRPWTCELPMKQMLLLLAIIASLWKCSQKPMSGTVQMRADLCCSINPPSPHGRKFPTSLAIRCTIIFAHRQFGNADFRALVVIWPLLKCHQYLSFAIPYWDKICTSALS